MRLVTDYLDISAEKFPNKVAFADEQREITFSQVKNEAKKIAMGIMSLGALKKPIAIFLEKSVECITSFMGTAYSGNFYTPIDTKMPLSRIEKIMATLNPAIVITDKKNEYVCREFANNLDILVYEDLMNNTIDEKMLKNCTDKIIDSDILYVLFTSGSTGNPKGVIIGHRSVIDYTEWVTETFSIDDKHIFGNQAPFYFDNSVLDIYQTIKNAATMYIIPEKLFAFPIKLLEILNKKKVNIIFWVPSALCLVANLKVLGKYKLDSINKILFCGEVMPNKQLNMWRKHYPEVLFANLYGPTEITDVCAYYIIGRKFNDNESLPIGRACKNTDILVLNDKNEIVKENEIGELCVRGLSLAYGYYNNPEKTAEVFVQNPLNKAYPEIIYRTGDLVRYNEYNELIYVSRKDFQIKHMGYRIELGEIETAASSLDGVEMNACVYDEKKSKIVMFYVGDIEDKNLVEKLKLVLPLYMLPNRIKLLSQMPINLNGKIDRVKLKEMI